jgi:Kef-type K+ transport system membrane component KefB
MLPMFDHVSGPAAIAICVVFATALTPQSPAVVMAILSETKADGPLSQIMLASVVVADLVIVLCYAVAAAVAGGVIGGGVDMVELVTSVSWELVGSIVFGVAVGMLIGQFVRSVPRGAAMFALLICVVVAQIATRVHLDPLIVTLTAGIWLENFSRADTSALLEGFESAQLPVFLVWFALSGTQLDLVRLWEGIVPVMILAAARALWFVIGTKLAGALTDAAPAVRRYSWIGLVPQAGLSLALMVTIRSNFPSFGADASVMILSLLGVNVLLSPVLLRSSLIRAGEAGKKQAADFAAH